MGKMILKLLLILSGIAIACMIVFLTIGIITDYRPEDREELNEIHTDIPAGTDAGNAETGDSLKILNWNIGYAGLGDNMDFFYDGGKKVRDSRERTEENLSAIIRTISMENPDVILLQEVDMDSKRTYGIDETRILKEAFPDYHMYFAYNYKSFYVPKPLREPIGKVASGIVILSRYRPVKVERHQYPSRFPFPVSMFNLKRCLMTAYFQMPDGRTLVIGNTHNTAYDTGGMRSTESDCIAELLAVYKDEGYDVVIGGDWNQYPASYVPSREETEDGHFSTVRLEEEKFSLYGRIEYAGNGQKTLRHLDRVLDGQSVLTVTDYFFLSDSLKSSEVRMLPLNFRNSDHNPVTITLKTRRIR